MLLHRCSKELVCIAHAQDPKALNFVVASAGRFRLPVTVDAVRQLLRTGADLPYQAKAAGARWGRSWITSHAQSELGINLQRGQCEKD
jgi:hypothetical protein